MGHQSVQLEQGQWVGWFAKQIPDPVIRLRFLQRVGPVPVAPAGNTPLKLRIQWLLPPLIFVLAASCYFLAMGRSHAVPIARPNHPTLVSAPRLVSPSTPVWQVEKSGNSETYSNGLRIDTRFAVSNHPRSYRKFALSGPDTRGTVGQQPVGIVFHTTESRQAPFEEGQNTLLQRLGESLLEYVQRRRAYNSLIDRFGRVYRVVAESDAANHAGYSVWADDHWLYVNLNESFLGVALEAQTEPGGLEAPMSPAQLRAAAILTEMLRSRFAIAPGNCVTHAQVSVNPSNMLVGYHTDWASSFPFAAIGLPDNYARPLPAVWAFAFGYDSTFLRAGGARMEASVGLAEDALNRAAAASGFSAKAYRLELRKRYRQQLAAVHSSPANQESTE